MANILVIEDEALNRMSMEIILENAGHQVCTAENGSVGLDLQKDQGFDLIITDIMMPEKEGLETLRELKETYPNLKVIVMSGGGRTGNKDYLESASLLGADQVLAKPFTEEQILGSVGECLIH